MKYLLMTAASAVFLAGSAFAQTSPDTDTNDNNMTDMMPGIDVSNAMIDGNKITGVTVTSNQPAYVVIHNEGEGAPPASLGHMRVEPGETSDLSIEADGELDPASGITLMLHYETNDNNTYDFGPGSTDVDTPAMGADGPINVPLQ
ncbi:DUF7282 domain-containing protein [Nitratireductor basaltis]|uniref:DUF7282 domain-containing protein n=1 Tax=Nitratireductor basaltis TaxID=472175 RepID=A0A084UBV6_9HYPH|nr:hypothetical protein [Nitratireductor basaltis]KFB10442.1 hypothetical protein EL18_01477 [Nitratireductor basaltis]